MVVAMSFNLIQHFICYLIQLLMKTTKYSPSSRMLKKAFFRIARRKSKRRSADVCSGPALPSPASGASERFRRRLSACTHQRRSGGGILPIPRSSHSRRFFFISSDSACLCWGKISMVKKSSALAFTQTDKRHAKKEKDIVVRCPNPTFGSLRNGRIVSATLIFGFAPLPLCGLLEGE